MVRCDGRRMLPLGSGVRVGWREVERMSNTSHMSMGVCWRSCVLLWASVGIQTMRGDIWLWRWMGVVNITRRRATVLQWRAVRACIHLGSSYRSLTRANFHFRCSRSTICVVLDVLTIGPYMKVSWEQRDRYLSLFVAALEIPCNCNRWEAGVVQPGAPYEIHQWRVWCAVEVSTQNTRQEAATMRKKWLILTCDTSRLCLAHIMEYLHITE